jgi:hypothetical protein
MIDPVTTLMVHEEPKSRFKNKLRIIKGHIKVLEGVFQSSQETMFIQLICH